MSRSDRPRAQKRAHAEAAVTLEQLRLVHVARRACRLEDDEYRQLLMRVAGVTSSKQLNAASFTAVMAYFKTIGFEHKPRLAATATRQAVRAFGSRPGMASDAQILMIGKLWQAYGGAPDDQALSRWLERSFGVSNLRFVTARTAQAAIEGLKVMVARKASEDPKA